MIALGMAYMTVTEIAEALGVSPGRVRQIISADQSFPPPAERTGLGRTRRWDSRHVQEWAHVRDRPFAADPPPTPDDLWDAPEVPPTYLGYRLVAGYDVMTFATEERKVALAQRRSGSHKPPTPIKVGADVVAMDAFDLGGDVTTRWGEVGEVMRDVFARWVTGQHGSGRMPWWEPNAVTPQMLATWRPGDPIFPVTIAEDATDPLWRLLADDDPAVVMFARHRLAWDLHLPLGPGLLGGSVEPIHARPEDVMHPVPGENVLVPVMDDVEDEDYEQHEQQVSRGAMALLGRRDAAAMHPKIALAACERALESTVYDKDRIADADLRQLISQWEPVTATAAHGALLPHPSKDVTAEFYNDPWLRAPAVVTTTKVVISARKSEPVPSLDIATVTLQGAGDTPVVTSKDGRVYLLPEHVAWGYRGSGDALTHHLLALIHGDRRPSKSFGDYRLLGQTALAEFLESEGAKTPGTVLTGEQVRDLAERPGWGASEPL